MIIRQYYTPGGEKDLNKIIRHVAYMSTTLFDQDQAGINDAHTADSFSLASPILSGPGDHAGLIFILLFCGIL